MGHKYMFGDKQQTNIIKRFFIQMKKHISIHGFVEKSMFL